MRRLLVVLTAAALLLAGCSSGPGPGPSTGPAEPGVLRVLGGSELAGMRGVLRRAEAATGVRVEIDGIGTVAGAEYVASGSADADYDALWFSSNRYLALQPGAPAKLGPSSEIMSSPVVLGLHRSVAERLGFIGRPVTWSEIAAAAGAKQFSYGMTDPSSSNTGFSAVVAVATALAGSGAALDATQAASTAPALKDFFAAQVLSAGSLGDLEKTFVARVLGNDPGPPVDGMITYESVLLGMNDNAFDVKMLELIYPSDGVVTAEYPLTLLAGASPEVQDRFRRLTEYLRTPEVQREIMSEMHARPAVPGVPLAPEFGTGTLVELPFPTEPEVVDTLLSTWFNSIRRPSRTIYVLDTSGSMAEGDRIGALRGALTGLARADESLVGRYRKFRSREQVTLLPFSSAPAEPTVFAPDEADPGPELTRLADAAGRLAPGGDTAIYAGLLRAYEVAAQQIAADPDRFTSIVLMTDGENTVGPDLAAFRRFAAERPASVRGVPVYPVLFGESDNAEMAEVAALTGGRTFDARAGTLAEAFSEIRGYV